MTTFIRSLRLRAAALAAACTLGTLGTLAAPQVAHADPHHGHHHHGFNLGLDVNIGQIGIGLGGTGINSGFMGSGNTIMAGNAVGGNLGMQTQLGSNISVPITNVGGGGFIGGPVYPNFGQPQFAPSYPPVYQPAPFQGQSMNFGQPTNFYPY